MVQDKHGPSFFQRGVIQRGLALGIPCKPTYLSSIAPTGKVGAMLILGGIPTAPITLGLGVFDGVHLGHQKIVARSEALLTFMPHPDHVLGKNKTLKYLTTLREQRALVPHLLGLRFTRQIAALPYDVFLEALCARIPVKALVVGEDFCCGAGRQGTPERLVAWGHHVGIPVHVEPLHAYQGQPVKSADIRDLILAGNLKNAVTMLGHPYPISGRVVAGKGMGRQLGFPTANLQIPRYKLLPPTGVYGGYCEQEGQRLPMLLYMGYRPTFGVHKLSIEVHILYPEDGDTDPHARPGFEMSPNRDLYGQQLSVQVCYPIRGDMCFETQAALIRQIEADREVVREMWRG